jgi:hypothetical protein
VAVVRRARGEVGGGGGVVSHERVGWLLSSQLSRCGCLAGIRVRTLYRATYFLGFWAAKHGGLTSYWVGWVQNRTMTWFWVPDGLPIGGEKYSHPYPSWFGSGTGATHGKKAMPIPVSVGLGTRYPYLNCHP